MNDTSFSPAMHMPDTQSERDERHVPIQRVGVRGLRYPVKIEVQGHVMDSVAEWTLDVALPAESKGTHMSRFVAWLDQLSRPLTAQSLREELDALLERLHAHEGHIEARFPFFLRKHAPVSGVSSLMDYQGHWLAERRDGATRIWAEVVVPVKSLCPCSKEISEYGAHNQRSHVTIRAELKQDLSWAELVRIAEDSASSEIWGLLKRPDEKWITERAYENPKFVEDLVRDVALRLNAHTGIGRYRVTVENFESIHNHSAYACVERN